MDLQLLKDIKEGRRLLALVLLILGIGLITSLLGILFVIPFVEGPVFEAIEKMALLETPGQINLMKYFQMVSQMAFFVLPALAFGFFSTRNIREFFQLQRFPGPIILILGLVIILVSNPFNEWLILQNNHIGFPSFLSGIENRMRESELKAAQVTNIFLEMGNWSDYLINLLMIGVLAALGEELLMRGVLQPVFIKVFKNAHVGIWMAAFVFSFIHFQFFGFFARLFLGAILGYFFYFSQNLWVSIIAHFFNNAFALTWVFITKVPIYQSDGQIVPTHESSPLLVMLSLVLVIVGLAGFRLMAKRSRQRDIASE